MFDDGRTPFDNRSPPSAQPQPDAKVLGWVIRSTDRDEQPEPVSQPRRPTRAAERSEGEKGGAGGGAPARGKRSAAAQTTKATRSALSADTSRPSPSWTILGSNQ